MAAAGGFFGAAEIESRSRCADAVFFRSVLDFWTLAALIRLAIVLALSVGWPLVVLISLGVQKVAICSKSSPRRWLG